jgi:Spy/CpxP family protein refolding chaperone
MAMTLARTVVCASACLLLASLQAPAALGQDAPSVPDQWAAVRFLLGSWEGVSEGQAGNGTVRREYRFVMRDQFIEERNTSTYPPQERNPRGEVHEHGSMISFDRARKLLVLRQFHVERFVIQYVQVAQPADSNLTFVSEATENTPAGWRARERYVILGPDDFEEIFELARTGQPFAVYSRTRLHRVK